VETDDGCYDDRGALEVRHAAGYPVEADTDRLPAVSIVSQI
jgi:hypothetical protein